MNLASLFLFSMLTGNVVLTKFLGICPFMGTSNKTKDAVGMGISVTLIVTLSSVITYLLYHYVLVPTDTIYLKTLVFILVIASFVQMLEMALKRFFKHLYQSLGIYLPLITTNCAVLGIVLLNISNEYNFLETLVFSFGSSCGFMLVLYIFSSVREYLNTRNIPNAMKGYPIALIVASIMAILFTRYTFL